MDLLLRGTEPPKNPESWMNRYLKPTIVALSLIAALFLTIYRQAPGGGIGIGGNKALNAAPGRTATAYNLTALKVFNAALVRVKDNYVKPDRIDPKQMLVAALDGVEKTVAEVMVQDAGTNRLLVQVDSYKKKFDISGVDSPWSLSGRMKKILQFVQSHLLKGTEIRDVEYAAINGMLSTLDPHSLLLPPETYNEMKLSTRGQFGGLGIVISMVKGVLTVMNPMKGTPAEQAGIKACDQILKIGEESTVNMTLNQAVNRLRGRPNSKVTVTLMRKGWARPVCKTLTRAVITVPAVKSRMLSKRVGYLRLSSFQGNSLADIKRHLAKLKQKGMRSLVLDLRGNPGGLLDQAIKISDLFIESGTLVTTVSLAAKRREEKRAHAEGTEGRYPIAVLVNSNSASASEIVAGALRNLDRAVVIGRRTFGKGTVQVLYDNDDGSALKLTIAEYLTPGDVSIQATGITPDIETRARFVREEYVHLNTKDMSRREKDLLKHLGRERIKPARKPFRTLFYLAEENPDKLKNKPKEKRNLCLYPDRQCEPDDDDEFVADFHIRTARDLLSRAQGWRRSQVLASAKDFFDKVQREQDAKLVDEAKKLGVDWSAAPPPRGGKPDLKVRVTMQPRQGKAKACHKSRITLTVKNVGSAPAIRVRGVSKSTNKIFDGHEFLFGRIDPGASKSWTVPVYIRDAPTRADDVAFKIFEAHGHTPDAVTYPISLEGMERPTFAYSYQLIDDVKGNLDGRAQRGEKMRLFVRVKNTGPGTSFRAITTLKNLSGVGVFIRKGRYILGKLAPGQSRSASFTFDLQKVYSRDTFKLELRVYDDALGELVTRKLKFDAAESSAGPGSARGAVRMRRDSVALRAWPDAEGAVVGHAPRGTVLEVVGKVGSWYRVLASRGRPAFVSGGAVTPGGTPTAGRFRALWQVTPPKIEVKVPTYATERESIRITGKATDETQVKDLYIFVRNPDAKISGRKVYYRSNGGSGKNPVLAFTAKIPLWPGANYVSVHARENEDVRAQESVVIYRKKDLAVAAEQPRQPSSDRPAPRGR